MSEEKSPSVALDRHLSIAEIAQQWGVSKDTVRRHFERVPGVLRLWSIILRHERTQPQKST